MAKIKLARSRSRCSTKPKAQPIELQGGGGPPEGTRSPRRSRKVFMLQYRTNAGEQRKPASQDCMES